MNRAANIDAISPITWQARAVWHVRLMGGVEAMTADGRLVHFPIRAVALLLARLALEPGRGHPREELIDMLWPGVDLPVGRNRLRQALSTLKALLEPSGGGAGAVLAADRHSVRVVAGALSCDVRALEAALREQRWADAQACLADHEGSEFMPGYYDDWVQDRRQELQARLDRRPVDDRPLASVKPLTQLGAFSAWAPHALAEVRLPRYLSTLFGAEAPVHELARRIGSARLLTLVGPGGAGKTRLAVEAAGRCAMPAEGLGFARVVFVPLVSCRSMADLLQAVGTALQLPAAAATDAPGLARSLAGARCLLLMDNCEQLQDEAVALMAALLSAGPELHVLATSRRVLALDGEQVVDLLPLPLPSQDQAMSLAGMPTAQDNPAMALFVDRARAVRTDFRLGRQQAVALAALVRLLDGLPLAIELAATRVRSFSPKDMLDALTATDTSAGQRLDLLQRQGPRSGVDARHASMRRVVQWSWDLLQPTQQRLLMSVSVFVAPFTAAAAGAVHDEPAALLLDGLVANSLLSVTHADDHAAAPGATRYALHEPVHEFVLEQMQRPNTDSDTKLQRLPTAHALRQRARHWLLGWVQALDPGTPLAALQNELAQLRALMRSAVADQACGLSLQITLALRPWWDSDGMSAADIQAIENALAQCSRPAEAPENITAPARADVHELLAYLHFGAGDAQLARQHAQAALQWAADADAPRARALLRLAWLDLASYRFGPALAAQLQEALVLAQRSGDRATQARVLHQMALHQMLTDRDLQAADALLQHAQALWLALGDRAKASSRQRSRAELLHLQRRWDEALAVYDQTEAQALADGDWVGLMDSNLLRGLALSGQRRWAAAAQALARCAQVAAQRHHAHGLAYALWHQARVLARLRRPHDAACLMGYATAHWESHVGPLGAHGLAFRRRVRGLVVAQADTARADAWLAAGALMDRSLALRLAQLLQSIDKPGDDASVR